MVAKDSYVIVLDFLPHGRPGDRRAEPIAQAIGEKFFNLLEIVIKDEITVKLNDRLYIGGDKREKVKYIRSRIDYRNLTNFSKAEIESTIKDLISSDEKRFVDLFNQMGPITTRLHSLELFPGIGKRHMWEIIKKRREKPFESFDDLKARVAMLPNPKKMIIKRILDELQNKDRHRLFVASGRI